MRGKSIIAVIMLILLLFSFIQAVPSNAIAVGDPVVTLQFHPGEETQHADVRPGEHGTVTFPGTVEARLPAGENIQDVVVYLSGRTDQGWAIEINPEVVQVNPGGQAAFSVTVELPPETSCDIEGRLTVDGRAQTFPGSGESDVPPIHGTIRVNQFFSFSLTPAKESFKGEQEDKIQINLEIKNLGNGQDSILIEISNLDYLKKKGFSISPISPSINLNSKMTETITLNVELPSEKKSIGTHELELGSYSRNQQSEEGYGFYKICTIDIKVEKKPLIDISTTNILLIILVILLIAVLYYIKKRREY